VSLKLAYQSRFGLARAAIYKDRYPHLYLEGLDYDPDFRLLGVSSIARLEARVGGVSFLKLADATKAVLDVPLSLKLDLGTAVEVTIIAQARADKSARARYVGSRPGEALARLSPVMNLKARISQQAQAIWTDTLSLIDPDQLEGALDSAKAQALMPSGPLACGGYLSIEPTRALIACDVDAGAAQATTNPKAHAKICNETAVAEVVRRLRLSQLAGLVVIDLIGQRHDYERLQGLMREAWGGEADKIIFGNKGRFGTLEFVRPWGAAPLSDTPVSRAVALMVKAVKLAQCDPGGRFHIKASPDLIALLKPLMAASHDPLGARLSFIVDDALPHGEIVSM
jgi:Ribonuclease E/G family